MSVPLSKATDAKRLKALMFVALVASQAAATNRGFGQEWRERFVSSAVYWASVASSADGAKLVAVGNSAPTGVSAVYTSTNSGATWTSNTAPFALWNAVASSADGNKLVAVARTGSVWISTNSGITWVAATNAPGMRWSSVASSSDGLKLVGATVSDQKLTFTNGEPYPPPFPTPIRANGSIFTSTDSGETWSSNSIPCNCFPNPGWSHVVSSADGSQLFAAGGFDGIYHSTDGGTNWTRVNSSINYAVSLAASADGSRVLATGFDDLSKGIWAVSTNSGQTWITTLAPMSGAAWNSVTSSADGTSFAVADYNHTLIYTSTDIGGTWITNNAPREDWLSIASSAEGSRLVALASYGRIYTWQYQPELRLAVSTTNAAVSWPYSPFASGFVLQQNSNLSVTGWANVGSLATNDRTNVHVTLDTPIGVRFFRLKR